MKIITCQSCRPAAIVNVAGVTGNSLGWSLHFLLAYARISGPDERMSFPRIFGRFTSRFFIPTCILTASVVPMLAPAQEERKAEPPAIWEMTLGEKALPLWKKLHADGKVTSEEVISANRELGDAGNGEAQAAVAWLLLGLPEDPIPLLRQIMKDEDAEIRAFAAGTAGELADVRLEPDLDALMEDKHVLGGKSESRFPEGTVGELAEDSLARLFRGGILSGDREEGSDIELPAWLKLAPAPQPAIDEAIEKADRSLYSAMEAAKVAWRRELAEALSSATEVEVMLLSGFAEPIEGNKSLSQYDIPRNSFPIVPYGQLSMILKRRTLEPDEVKLLMPSLKETIIAEGHSGGAFCHYPIHGIRIYNGLDSNGDKNIVFQSSICYVCGNFYVAKDGDADWLGLTSPRFQEVMESLMPIPKNTKELPPKPTK